MEADFDTMKLSAKERTYLRYALRSHPDILSKVRKLSDISALDKKSLLIAAAELGIDIQAAKSGTLWDDRASLTIDEKVALSMKFSETPAFVGAFEEQMTFVLLGQAITRTLRVSYEMTPAWPYFDPATGKDVHGWEQSSMRYEFLVRREVGLIQDGNQGKARRRGEREEWVNCTELFMHELLGADFDEVIDDRIEETCLRENEERKRSAMKSASA